MSEFFLELFSEEIPPKLQTNARKKILLDFKILGILLIIFEPIIIGYFLDFVLTINLIFFI